MKNHLSSRELVKVLFAVYILVTILTCQPGMGRTEDIPTQGELSNKAMAAYRAGNPEECLEYLQQAVELYPNEQAVHLNFASLAYQIALELKRQGEEEKTWGPLASIAAVEFSETILMGKDSTDDESRAITGHAAFLMGDLWHYLYDNPEEAYNFFELSKEYSPDSELLKREMAIIRQKVGEDYIPQPINIYEMKRDGNSRNK